MREYFTFFLFFSVWVYVAAAAYPWPDKVVQEKGYINVRSFYYFIIIIVNGRGQTIIIIIIIFFFS